MQDQTHYHIEGSYYEACNCNAICPCRRQNGVALGRATYETCDFVLSWLIKRGHLGSLDLSGRTVCMVGSYRDDEPGSPWSIILYIDETATERQHHALSKIFRGEVGGNMAFTANIGIVHAVKPALISLDHTMGAETIRIANITQVHVDRRIEFDGTVSCGIPGHDHPGHESVSSLSVHDGPFQWTYVERCGFSTDFAYFS